MAEELRKRIERTERQLRDLHEFEELDDFGEDVRALIAALREAEEVAEAVRWCAAHDGAFIIFCGEGDERVVKLHVPGFLEDGDVLEAQTLLELTESLRALEGHEVPAAVAALRARVEGKQ